jgi:hypothetical protein
MLSVPPMSLFSAPKLVVGFEFEFCVLEKYGKETHWKSRSNYLRERGASDFPSAIEPG